jgi:FtsP/CotA-like multicopper oxidase with cupredoxin domain
MTQMQSMMGLGGGFIISDQNCKSKADKDFFYILQEFQVKGLEHGEIKPGIYDIDHMSHDFNFFTMNGKCFPSTTPMEVKQGENIRVRFANFMHDAHPMHIHGHQFEVIASDGNRISSSKRILKNTINVASGETWDTLFKANNPGIWPYHCHIPHHMTNNMTEPGGMFTTVIYK